MVRTWKTRVLSVAVATAAAVGGVVGVAPEADAATWGRCPKDAFCLFTGFSGTGAVAIFRHGDDNLNDSNRPCGMNDNTRSFSDRTSLPACLYQNKGRSHFLWAAPTHKQGNLPQLDRHSSPP